MSSLKPRPSERVPRMLTNACSALTEREQNRTEQVENRYGMGLDTEQIKTGTGIHVEWQQNAFCQAFPVNVSSAWYWTMQLYMYSLSTTETLLTL